MRPALPCCARSPACRSANSPLHARCDNFMVCRIHAEPYDPTGSRAAALVVGPAPRVVVPNLCQGCGRVVGPSTEMHHTADTHDPPRSHHPLEAAPGSDLVRPPRQARSYRPSSPEPLPERLMSAAERSDKHTGNESEPVLMRVVCVGGGPAGLYLAILLKRADANQQVVVLERKSRHCTDGWGVVF